jgi:hypothetical protein
MSEAARKPGQYAAERHFRGLKSYRRRLYRQMLGGLLLVALGELVFAIWVGTTFAWAAFAFVLGVAFGTVYVLRELPPDHVRRWGDGAWGEQQTAKALEPLEREGWKVTHDIALDRGNIDHLVEAPNGRRFLLETKSLNGDLSVVEGVLTAVQVDDPEQISRHSGLRHIVLERARGQDRERAGRGGWVQAAVVIWGDFPQGLVEDGKLVFLHGDRLVEWLRERV